MEGTLYFCLFNSLSTFYMTCIYDPLSCCNLKHNVIINHIGFFVFFVFFEKKIYFHKTNLQKKSYIQYQTYYIQKKRNKGKKETRNIKRRKKKKWG